MKETTQRAHDTRRETQDSQTASRTITLVMSVNEAEALFDAANAGHGVTDKAETLLVRKPSVLDALSHALDDAEGVS